MIKLGDKVRDKHTGFTGTLMARAKYLYGCVWLLVVADDLHDGKPVEAWFDEPRVERATGETAPEAYRPHTGRTHGPAPKGPSRSTPDPGRSD